MNFKQTDCAAPGVAPGAAFFQHLGSIVREEVFGEHILGSTSAATSSFLLLVAMPRGASSVLAPSSTARSP